MTQRDWGHSGITTNLDEGRFEQRPEAGERLGFTRRHPEERRFQSGDEPEFSRFYGGAQESERGFGAGQGFGPAGYLSSEPVQQYPFQGRFSGSEGRWSAYSGPGTQPDRPSQGQQDYGPPQQHHGIGEMVRGFAAELGITRPRGPKNYRRSDTRIMEDVCDRLGQHPDMDASDLEVEVKDGEITLKGTVPQRYMKRLAEDIADVIPGVQDVHNEVRVKGSITEKLFGDESIAPAQPGAVVGTPTGAMKGV